MTNDISANLETASEAEETRFRTLIEIYLDMEIAEYVRLAANTTKDIVFNGNTYQSAQIQVGDITQTQEGDLKKLSLKLSNNDLSWAQFFANYANNFQNKLCTVYEVSEDYLTDPADAVVKISGIVNNIQMNAGEFAIDVEETFGQYDNEAPIMTYNPMCQWKKFKDTYCGYTGAETKCDRTLTRCMALDNEENFGGHPSMIEEQKID